MIQELAAFHGAAANVADVTQVAELLHGEENAVYADAGYTGVEKRKEHEHRNVIWQIAARRSTYSRLSKRSVLYKARRKIEYCKARTRAKVEHPFRVIKRQFGYVKVRFRGPMKNTAQLTTLFALSNLWDGEISTYRPARQVDRSILRCAYL